MFILVLQKHFILNKFLINFLIDRSRHTGINSKSFNFVWNIKGSHASSDFQNEVKCKKKNTKPSNFQKEYKTIPKTKNIKFSKLKKIYQNTNQQFSIQRTT